MKYCSHCGKQIEDNAEICMGCGCRVYNKPTLTLYREGQSFLARLTIHVEVKGKGISESCDFDRERTVQYHLSPGIYEIAFSVRNKTTVRKISLEKDTIFRFGVNRPTGTVNAWIVDKI